MAWLNRKKSAVVEAEPEVIEAAAAAPTGLPLGVLVPDSGGISSFLLTMHPDTASAEAQIGKLRADVRRGTHAFWAMHERPAVDDTMHVEAIVLIRAKPDSDIVYVVSFLDLESALSFTRFELRRGLHIRNVMIYWAAFTQVREELEGVSILPTTPPPTISEAPLPPDIRLAPPPPAAPRPSASVLEVEQEAASAVQSEAREAVERYIRQNPKKAPQPVAEQPAAEQPAVVEDSLGVAEPPLVAQAPAVAEPETGEEPWPPAKVVRTPRITQEPAAIEKAAVEEALVLQHPPVAEPVAEPELPPEAAGRQPSEWTPKRRYAVRDDRQPSEQPAIADEPTEVSAEPIAAELTVAEPAVAKLTVAELIAAQQAAEPALAEPMVAELVISAPGDEEGEWEEAIASGEVVDPAGGFPANKKYDEFDIALEVEQLLKNRKWETRSGPFSGFKSPPGRF